jgi:tetratricopeptide (TPR) repeat protein
MLSTLLLTLALALPQQQSPAQAPATEVAARFSRAVDLQRRGALEEAAAEYRALLALAPDYAEAQANFGAVLSRLERHAEAVAAYEAALRLKPSLTPVYLNLGIAHYRAGQFARAADVLERFLAAAPGHAQARQLRGVALVELGRDQEAVAELEPTLAAAPDDLTVLYSLGTAYLRLRRADVSPVIQRLKTLPGGEPLALTLEGQAHLERFEFELAAASLEAASRLAPDLPRLSGLLGLSYLKLGRRAEAVACFERELSRAPEDFAALYYLASLHEAMGDLGAARRRVESALKAEPRSAAAHALRGKILLRQGRAAEALKAAEAALAEEPENADHRFLRARIYQRLNRPDDAAREFAEVERLKARQRRHEMLRKPQP